MVPRPRELRPETPLQAASCYAGGSSGGITPLLAALVALPKLKRQTYNSQLPVCIQWRRPPQPALCFQLIVQMIKHSHQIVSTYIYVERQFLGSNNGHHTLA